MNFFVYLFFFSFISLMGFPFLSGFFQSIYYSNIKFK